MTIPAIARKAADLFVACLESEGVTHIFGVPGEENLDLVESLRNSSIRLVTTRHEQAAAFMAATLGRLTGRAGVALATLGPGATNLITGVAYAQLGAMPLVALTGQKPIKRSKQGRFQILDVVATMVPITKMAAQVPSAEKIPSLVREVFRLAEEDRPGATHLELPEDIAAEMTFAAPLVRMRVRRPGPDLQALAEAAAMILHARHPLLLVAAAANRKGISESLGEFVDKTGIPFFSTQMGKGVLDERRSGYLGTAALTEGDYLHCAIERADLIISVGHDITEKPPAIMGHGNTARVIHLHFSPARIDDVYFPSLEVIGDISQTIHLLTAQLEPSPNWDFTYFYRMRDEHRRHLLERSEDPGFPMKPQRFVRDLRQVMPDDGILALDNGMYKIWIARNYPAYFRHTVLLDNALATMGTGLPSAMAAKMVMPERRVVAICGDGGFMMNSQELETAVRLGLDLTVVVVNDSGYGMIKWKQESMGLANFGLDFRNPDFVRYAESYGAFGHRVESADGFVPVMERCLRTPGVHLVDLPIDYSENVRVLTHELKEKVCLI
ncbi:MAG: acetolactate synthase large subunit [Magnetococcales bacterium]|nr:acetolactate synthase large subunit [Magnetococcales bacterium]MBF0156191.1 acetolactate synthase large subunit [Magnetococcales bacterium]